MAAAAVATATTAAGALKGVQNLDFFSNLLTGLTGFFKKPSLSVPGLIDFSGLDILLIVLFILAVVGFGMYQFMLFKKKEMVKNRKGTLFQIKPGLEVVYKKSEKKIRMMRLMETFTAGVGTFIQNLQTVEPCYSFEIHANGVGGYGTFIWVPEEEVQHLPAKMRSLYEQPQIVKEDDEPMKTLYEKLADEKGFSRVKEFFTAEYQLGGEAYMPIREWYPDKGEPDDPMEQLFGIFDGLRGNHIAGLIVTIKPTNSKWKEEGMEAIQDLQYEMPAKKSFLGKLKPGSEAEAGAIKRRSLDAFQKARLIALTDKMKQDGFAVTVRVYSSDQTTFQLLGNALEKRFKGDYNQLVKKSDQVSLEEMKLRWFEKNNMVLSIGEVATIFHFADSETKAERLQRGGSSTAAPDENLAVIKENEDFDLFDEVNSL
jgi:hypothetical protein